MTPNGNQPAYPSEVSIWTDPRMGLTKREAFAMAAMRGAVSQHAQSFPRRFDDQVYQTAAMHAVAFADALLAELERTKVQ